MSNPRNLLIIAGESSGELYGALLAQEILHRNPECHIKGVGGRRMADAGVNLIAPIASAFGLTEAFRALKELRETFARVKRLLDEHRPDIVVLIDYPDFNFKVAQEAKKRGIPVLYYVSPQVWAWRTKRVYTMKKIADMIALILPFEEEIYRTASIRFEFVGHPALDEIEQYLNKRNMTLSDLSDTAFKEPLKRAFGVDYGLCIGLLPGSRRHEIKTLLPVIVESARQIREAFRDVTFIMPIAPNIEHATNEFILNSIAPLKDCLIILKGDSIGALAAADLAIIASGTATFQATMLNVPMVVIYKVSALSYFIGRLLIKVNHIALSDLLLEKCYPNEAPVMIKELVQSDVNAQNILSEIDRLINDRAYYNEMLKSFQMVRSLFLNHRASKRVAEIIEEMLN